MRRDAVAGQPRVAVVAAGRAATGTRVRGLSDGERRAPPRLRLGLGVALRLDRARLAVADEPEQHAVGGGLVRHAQPQRPPRRRARRGRSRTYSVGAVVMRLREQRGSRSRAGSAMRVRSSLDRALRQAADDELLQDQEQRRRPGSPRAARPAANGPQCCPYCWSMKPCMPTGSVKWSCVWSIALAITNSLIVKTNEISPTTARIGRGERQTTPQKICAGGRAVDARRLVELARDRVEEALHQPRVARPARRRGRRSTSAVQRVEPERAEDRRRC